MHRFLEILTTYYQNARTLVYDAHAYVQHSFLTWQTAHPHPIHINRRSRSILLLLLLIGGWTYVDVIRAPLSFPVGELITISEGSTLPQISSDLHDHGVVRNKTALALLVRMYGNADSIKAGDYLFKEPKNLFAVARIISIGAFGLEPLPVRIPEGSDTGDMALIFEKRLLRFDPEHFLKLATPHEGYLFPDTYYFMPNVREEAIIQVMTDNFARRTEHLNTEVASLGKSWNEIVIMASIIEKEASRTTDRHKISGVLWHRLSIGMPLQVDATFFYTHDKGTYHITLAELRDASNPYNTYIHKGLPPGPIASPSVSSIEAAIRPTPMTALFYLADRSGNTYYSDTYAEHLRKKTLYVD